MPLGLLALAMGGFGIGLTEFVLMGLLPDVADTYDVTEVAAGWLISGYALSVVVGALVVTALVARFPRKPVLMNLLGLFIAGNFLCAIAPTYELMLGGRVIAALCHGAFFGIGAVVAADLVAPEKRAGAIAIMFAGLTTATVLGVPFGTFIGQQFGWRATFFAISAIGVVALVGIGALVSPQTEEHAPPQLRSELQAFRSGQVWVSIAVTILGYGGMFGAFTYIAYTLTDVTGFSEGAVPPILVLFGVGMFAGNLVGGKAADRWPSGTLIVALSILTLVLLGFASTADSRPMAVFWLFAMGGVGFATVPGLQARIMSYAPGAPTMASSANIAAFNVGNALGAWLGGVAIAAGGGYTSPIWVGAGLTALALIVMSAATRRAATPAPELVAV